MSNGNNDKTTATGVVEEVLPNSLFRVRLSPPADGAEKAPDEARPPEQEAAVKAESGQGGELVLAYLAGKMRLHRIRVLMGDTVEMVLDPYGGRARIVRRLS